MVWCPIHNRYINGKKAREYHAKKLDCPFIRNYKVDRQSEIRYNNRNKDNKNPDLMGKYLWIRERRKRSIYRTNKKKGKR